jgi:c-di-GMP-binding flagellar brake protein YcgR
MAHSSIPDDIPYQVRCRQDERRRQPRLRCKGTAEVRVLRAGATFAGTIADLSVSGCCVVTQAELPRIEQPVVEVILTVNSSTLRVAGVVRNVKNDRRAGIEFIDVTRRKADQILELVKELKEREDECLAQIEEGEEATGE